MAFKLHDIGLSYLAIRTGIGTNLVGNVMYAKASALTAGGHGAKYQVFQKENYSGIKAISGQTSIYSHFRYNRRNNMDTIFGLLLKRMVLNDPVHLSTSL